MFQMDKELNRQAKKIKFTQHSRRYHNHKLEVIPINGNMDTVPAPRVEGGTCPPTSS